MGKITKVEVHPVDAIVYKTGRFSAQAAIWPRNDPSMFISEAADGGFDEWVVQSGTGEVLCRDRVVTSDTNKFMGVLETTYGKDPSKNIIVHGVDFQASICSSQEDTNYTYTNCHSLEESTWRNLIVKNYPDERERSVVFCYGNVPNRKHSAPEGTFRAFLVDTTSLEPNEKITLANVTPVGLTVWCVTNWQTLTPKKAVFNQNYRDISRRLRGHKYDVSNVFDFLCHHVRFEFEQVRDDPDSDYIYEFRVRKRTRVD